jgi:hypothetical protein
MSLRLALVSWWTPKRVLAEMLGRVEESTVAALDCLLEKRAPAALAAIRAAERAPEGGLPARRAAMAPAGGLPVRRAAMASAHNVRIRALVAALGRENAISEGREALFPVGVMLGKEARGRLGTVDSPRDLERAARVLYKALGIDFTLEKLADGGMMMRVHRCALAGYYKAESCAILSAADEGVVRGLNPKLMMRFEQRMTDGPAECLARIGEEKK